MTPLFNGAAHIRDRARRRLCGVGSCGNSSVSNGFPD
jgi:hypothetical protein